jgi:hypothetical protein
MTVRQLGADQSALEQAGTLEWQVGPTPDTVWANFPVFLDKQSLLKNQVLCMDSPDDSVTAGVQEDLNASFRAELRKLGYRLEVDITYGSAPNDGVAVEQFRTKGCTVALIMGFSLTEPSGFQSVAEQQGYRPKYPIAESSSEMNDGVADVTYNATAEDGNIGFKAEFAQWTSRQPPVAAGNAAANYCLSAFQAYEHHSLDLYNDYAVVVNALESCAPLEVARQAIANAGPDLTWNSFVAGMERISNMQTSDYFSVSFGPAKQAGSNEWAPAQFNKNRWQPEDTFWGIRGPWTPMFLGSFGAG